MLIATAMLTCLLLGLTADPLSVLSLSLSFLSLMVPGKTYYHYHYLQALRYNMLNIDVRKLLAIMCNPS